MALFNFRAQEDQIGDDPSLLLTAASLGPFGATWRLRSILEVNISMFVTCGFQKLTNGYNS